ncbi:type IV toxin-antitoxin system AbiEi family antitoxin domain-containing protein [Lapillicoccus sp.]|uniref:type IV toxin-antitoxin system AbiEi family antitoxin domain-containing protein n=1 Tax=Lapillicoccus sp. TaxID=1909287 RepID=UPI0039C92ED5
MDLPPPVLDLARRQRGVLTRRQLTQLGISPAQVRWRLGRSWRLVLPGVVLRDWALPSDLQRGIAALLYAGPRSWLSGPSAGVLHRVLAPTPRAQAHVLVAAPGPPEGRRVAVYPAHARRGQTSRDQRSTPLLVPAESGRRPCGRDAAR